jgi:hypothetical protein
VSDVQPTGIELNAKLSIWFILNMIFPLTVDVDGTPTKGVWGPQVLNLAPGIHRLTVSWKFYWVLPIQRGVLDVTVNPGDLVKVRYKVRWLIFLPGKLYVEPATAA